jgi:8-oxo-dGTP pyrophosphatase MutT (NUDIX family)
LIYIKDKDSVILVSQERAPMMRDENPTGRITEVPAGRFDVKLTPKQLIAKEAQEEVGMIGQLADDRVTLLNFGGFLALSPGILTERQILGFVEIESSEIEEEERTFGVDEDEKIRRVMLKVEHLQQYQFEDMKSFALTQWFINYLREQGRSF